MKRMTRTFTLVLLLLVPAISQSVASVVEAGPSAASLSGPGRFIAPIVDWNRLALDTVREERAGAAAAGRLYAMVNVAIYDAVNGIDVACGFSSRQAALVELPGAPLRAARHGLG